MKNIRCLLVLPLLWLVACTQRENIHGGEAVTVSFRTALSERDAIRRTGEDTHVDRVVCAVFEDGEELKELRQTLAVEGDAPVVFTPVLIREHVYTVAFWAMRGGSYDVTDMECIVPSEGETFTDAFTNQTEIRVTDVAMQDVVLKRPLARIHVGMTAEEWNSLEAQGIQPVRMEMTVSAGYAAYDALQQDVAGEMAERTFSLPVLGKGFTVGNTMCRLLSTCYLPLSGGTKAAFRCTIYGRGANDEEVQLGKKFFSDVLLEVNHTTNLVSGSWLAFP